MRNRLIAVLATLALLAGLATAAAPQAAASTITVQATQNVWIRTGPATSYSTVYLLQGGQYVWVYCYVTGQSINGDPIWYRVKPNPNNATVGYTAGYYLTTGADPNPNVGHC
jgi:uncharacterized protein YgiM (DUF1202 family)